MLPNHRPSILHRPKGRQTTRNDENLEKEYKEEMARLAAKAERKASAEDRLRKALYPQPDDISNNRKELQATMEQAKIQRAEAERQQQETDQRWANSSRGVSAAQTREMDPAAQAELARRRAAEEVARENEQLAQLKKLERQRQASDTKRLAQSAFEHEEGWWNYGAASEKWIAPEHRVRGKGCRSGKHDDMKGQGLHPWSWQAPEHLSEGQSRGGAAEIGQAPTPFDEHPRRHFKTEQFAVTTGLNVDRAPFTHHEGPANTRSNSPDMPHRRPAQFSQSGVSTGDNLGRAPFATNAPKQSSISSPPPNRRHFHAPMPTSPTRAAPFHTEPEDQDAPSHFRSSRATSRSGTTASQAAYTLATRAPFGRDDQVSADRPTQRVAWPASACPFGRDDRSAPHAPPPPRAPYPYARPLAEDLDGTLPPSRSTSPDRWQRSERLHLTSPYADSKQGPYRRSSTRPEQRIPAAAPHAQTFMQGENDDGEQPPVRYMAPASTIPGGQRSGSPQRSRREAEADRHALSLAQSMRPGAIAASLRHPIDAQYKDASGYPSQQHTAGKLHDRVAGKSLLDAPAPVEASRYSDRGSRVELPFDRFQGGGTDSHRPGLDDMDELVSKYGGLGVARSDGEGDGGAAGGKVVAELPRFPSCGAALREGGGDDPRIKGPPAHGASYTAPFATNDAARSATAGWRAQETSCRFPWNA